MKDEVAGVLSWPRGLRAGEALHVFGICVAADDRSAKGVPESLRWGVAFIC